jgi:hypothetical protein
MATLRGGDVRQFVYNGREYGVAVDSEWTYHPGRNGRAENETSILPNGELSTSQRLRPVGISSGTLSVRPGGGDAEALQTDAKSGEAYPCTITLVDGTVYAGQLVLNGELAPTSNGQVEFSALGATFERI